MKFDEAVIINGDKRGEFIFSWLRQAGDEPIRVEVWRPVVEDNWHIPWSESENVRNEFLKLRNQWIEDAIKHATVVDGIRRFCIIDGRKSEVVQK